MGVISRLRKQNVSGVVTAYGEVLFLPGAQVYNWSARFSARIRAETVKAAPTNERPRWAHYGKPLKMTIKAPHPQFQKTRGGARVNASVGSTAPYAYYVDQGTGIHGGNGPYLARILPPWTQGSPSLYEATWRPNAPGQGPGRRLVAPVMIDGQRGQHFFDIGLYRGFQRMRMRSFQVPGEGVRDMTAALDRFFPRGLEFDGNTLDSPAFRMQLTQWRKWRDEAWANDQPLGENGTSDQQIKFRQIARDRAERAKTDYERQTDAINARIKRENKQIVKKHHEKTEAEKRKEAEALLTRKRADYGTALAKARQYADALRAAYPNVEVLRSPQNFMARVVWHDSDGTRHQQDFR